MKNAKRNTVQKSIVLDSVTKLKIHPTADEIYELVHENNPAISKATVYRNLNSLAEDGQILRVEIPNAADRYDFNNSPHYHLQCIACGKVFDVKCPYQENLNSEVQENNNCIILGHDIVFKGICGQCIKKNNGGK